MTAPSDRPLPLRRPLPPGRTYEQVYRQFVVERRIADELRRADRNERKAIYQRMYDELFRACPDHPRLTGRDAPEEVKRRVRRKLRALRRWLTPEAVVVEFAPGDCTFSIALASHVKRVVGVDLSNQADPATRLPDNFTLTVYDGYDLSLEKGFADVVTSDQLIEHIPTDDLARHLELVQTLLKPGGAYVFLTPHAFSGPYDVSAYFCDEPEGFHMKEYTHREMAAILRQAGYRKCRHYWAAAGFVMGMPYAWFALAEAFRPLLGRRPCRKLARGLLPCVMVAAIK